MSRNLIWVLVLAGTTGCASSEPRFDPVGVIPPVTAPLPGAAPAGAGAVAASEPWKADGTLAQLPEVLQRDVWSRAERAGKTLERLRARESGLELGPPEVEDDSKPLKWEFRLPDESELALEKGQTQQLPAPPARRPAATLECISGDNEALVRCARRVHIENTEDLLALQRDLQVVQILAPLSTQYDTLYRVVRQALDVNRESAQAAGARSSQYGFYAGPNYSLGGDGTWRAGYEFMGRFSTEAFRRGMAFCRRCWYRGYTEVSYQRVNALDEAGGAATSGADGGVIGGGAPAALDDTLANPFAAIGGYLRTNLGLQLHWTDWSGAQFGGGYSSLPNDDDVTRMKPRAFVGPHFETLFGDGAYGSVFAGYAHDEFWEREVFRDPNDPSQGTVVLEEFERFNIDVQIMFPAEVLGTRAAARMFIDTPLDGNGPSDVRASLLLYYSLSDWIGLFGPVRDVAGRLPGLTPALSVVR